MKFRIINIFLASNILIGTVALGLTGRTPEEDDCPHKYNEFRKYRDILDDLAMFPSLIDGRCLDKACVELGMILGLVHYSMTPFGVFCDKMDALLPFFTPSDVADEILRAADLLIKAGKSIQEAINLFKSGQVSLSEAAKKAISENFSPTDWDKILEDVEREIAADEQLKCLEEKRVEIPKELQQLDQAWDTAMKNYENAVKAIKEGETACDKNFSHTPPKKPNYSCTPPKNPKKGNCAVCGLRNGAI